MIFDCFIFFNEFELLEIRLNELNDVVDKFVLVEATKTHQGKDKPLYFEENKKQFSDFLNKMIHIAVSDYPKRASPLQLEYHQRNKISEGLNTCFPEDQIIISDIDEIPRPAKIIKLSDGFSDHDDVIGKICGQYLRPLSCSFSQREGDSGVGFGRGGIP